MTRLRFEERSSASGKTKIISVYNNESGEALGIISWRGTWRQYVWSQIPMIDMSWDCLQEVVNKTKELMEERKNK